MFNTCPAAKSQCHVLNAMILREEPSMLCSHEIMAKTSERVYEQAREHTTDRDAAASGHLLGNAQRR